MTEHINYGIAPLVEALEELTLKQQVEWTGGGNDWLTVQIEPDKLLVIGWLPESERTAYWEHEDVGLFMLRGNRDRNVGPGDLLGGMVYRSERQPGDEMSFMYNATEEAELRPAVILDFGVKVALVALIAQARRAKLQPCA